MRFEILLVVCYGCVIEGKKRGTGNSEENEVLDKGDVTVRFPSYLYEVPKEALQRNLVQRRFRGRNVPTSVEPMEGTCYVCMRGLFLCIVFGLKPQIQICFSNKSLHLVTNTLRDFLVKEN